MREIKFRAWDLDSKKYLKGDFSLGIETGQFRGKYGEVFNNVILEQFIGLKDKNGKDIYEGDIIKRIANLRDYSDADGTEEDIYEVNYSGIDLLPFSETGTYMEEYEIIGNIHENPELIK